MKVSENKNETNIIHINDNKTVLNQIKHEFINVGETLAQVKYNTSVKVSEKGTVIVSQFKQEISSREDEVFYFSNDTAIFEGGIKEAKSAFEKVDFDKLNLSLIQPSFNVVKPLKWENNNNYESNEPKNKPISWSEWGSAVEKALDELSLNREEDAFSECIDNVILLARGKYKKTNENKLKRFFNNLFK